MTILLNVLLDLQWIFDFYIEHEAREYFISKKFNNFLDLITNVTSLYNLL